MGVIWAKTRVVCLWETVASGWGSPWESSSLNLWLLLSANRYITVADPEWPWSSGFRRNSSSLVTVLRIRLLLLLKSSDNISFIIPSMSFETWVVYCSCDLVTLVFCAGLHLDFSSQLFWLGTASFSLFLRVAIFYRKNRQYFKTEFFIDIYWQNWYQYFYQLISIFIDNSRENRLLKFWEIQLLVDIISLYSIVSFRTFVLPFLLFITFIWRETQLFTLHIKVQKRKSTLIILLTQEKHRLGRKKKHFSIHFSLRDDVFSIFLRKMCECYP